MTWDRWQKGEVISRGVVADQAVEAKKCTLGMA